MNLISHFYLVLQVAAATGTTKEADFRGLNVGEFVTLLYKWGIGVGTALAGLIMIYAGYIYMTTQGSPDGAKTAKDLIVGALLGLALLILAGVILKNVVGLNY